MLCFYSDYKITYFFYLRQFFTLYFLFFERHENRRTSFFERHENRRTCFIPQPKNMFFFSSVLSSQAIPMFFCSPVLPLANNPHVLMFSCLIPASNPHVLMFSCLIPRKQSPCSHVLLSSPKNMFFCLITMHIFLIPIKILNCFSLPFQISFILLYINILSLRKIENSIYTFYRNGTSTL